MATSEAPIAKPWITCTSFSEVPKKMKRVPTPSRPIEATVSPMIDPPKKAVVRAAPAPLWCAARAVRTFTWVAEYIPM